jgi:hypothetical protein
MLSLLAYLLLTTGVSAVAGGSAAMPFLLLRACFPLLLMHIYCSWCFLRLFSDVPDFFGFIAAVDISVVGGPRVVNFLYFSLHSSVRDVPGVSSAAVDPAIADVLAAAGRHYSLCCCRRRPTVA